MVTLHTVDDLLDALPFLAPSNAVGYHRARERLIARYEEIRPRTWADVGIDNANVISEYEKHCVSADDVAHARVNGWKTINEIIAAYGIPPSDGWR